jgi:YegS/Rv2252/BmrU family lipid kinase
MSALGTAAGLRPVSATALRTVFVVNPVAGRASARGQRMQRLEDFIRSNRLDARIEMSRRGGHAEELSRAAADGGAGLVVSVGGDGTMNEVARALVGRDVLFGMVPVGSGNGLGRDLGLPLDPGRALEVLLDGAVREIDTGEVNGLPFFNVMGLGFDAEIGRRFNLSHRRGFFTYLRIGLQAYFSYRRERLRIVPEGAEPVTVDAFLTTAANSTQYGNNARIAPRALLDDGLLDLVTIPSKNPIRALGVVYRLFTASLDRSRTTQTFRAARFRVERAAPGPVHTDGEVHHCGETLDIHVRPRSLKVVVPRIHSSEEE